MNEQVPGAWRVVSASAADAEAMAAVYREAYPAVPGSPAGSGYPFPQYMSAHGLARCLRDCDFRWLTAKCGQEVIGCLGAVTCSSPTCNDDRVAELTGLVVRTGWRGNGVGQALVRAMCRELEE